jgi:hypothetical protein
MCGRWRANQSVFLRCKAKWKLLALILPLRWEVHSLISPSDATHIHWNRFVFAGISPTEQLAELSLLHVSLVTPRQSTPLPSRSLSTPSFPPTSLPT